MKERISPIITRLLLAGSAVGLVVSANFVERPSIVNAEAPTPKPTMTPMGTPTVLPSGITVNNNVSVNLPEGFVLRPGTFVITREELDKRVQQGIDSALRARGVKPSFAPESAPAPIEVITRTVAVTNTITIRTVEEGFPWEPGYPWRVAALWAAIGAVIGGAAWHLRRRIHLPHHHPHEHPVPPAGGPPAVPPAAT